jgi:hypothetical protein
MLDVHRRRNRRRPARLPRLIATLAVLAVPAALGLQSAGAAVAQPQAHLAASSSGDTKCATSSNRTTTCTGTYGGDRAWIGNPVTGVGKVLPASRPATVTVSPTTDLVSQVVHVSWANFTPTLNMASVSPEPNADDGDSGEGDPNELYNVAVYECRGTVPQGGPGPFDGNFVTGNCYSLTDTTQVQATAGAANGVVGFTSPNGTGQANIYVEAGDQNSFLHCGDTSPCSLVVVPNWGGREPYESLTEDCSDHSWDHGGPIGPPFQMGAYTFLGAACSWGDRIVVPLSFAPSTTDCPTNAAPAFQAAGSPMMEAAMEQWQARWCTGKSALSFGYTSEDEYTARQEFLTGSGALSASVDMALVTQPATDSDSNGALPAARHYTYAPLANSAVAFAYYIDNPSTGEPYTNLVLNARLAAKLLTQSYALNFDCTQTPPFNEPKPPAASSTCDPAVSHNPDTIFDDPEFFTLNGGDTKDNTKNFPNDGSFPDTLYGSFLPTVVSGTSDMTYELTGWIESDPDAHAFLGGQRETGGSTSMAVNKYYRDIAYPTSQFETLDTGWSTEPTKAPGGDDESMQAAWNPVNGLDNVATDLATYDPTSDNPTPICALSSAQCTGNTGYENPRLPGEYLGQDNMTAVVAESQAAADAFPVFRLVNAAGKAVAPTSASILAAVSQMKTNPDGITQSMNFANKNPDAYPLTMVDYAMVPTCGLSRATASAISAFLTDVATKGQTPGYLPGQLAPGYAPLNSHQLAQLKTAASRVGSKGRQQCPKGGGGTGGSGGGSPAGGSGGTGSGGSPGSGSGHGTQSATTAKLGNAKRGASNAGYAVKNPFTAGLARFIVPLLLVLGGLLALGGPVAYVLNVTGAGPVVYQRIGALPHRVTELARGTLARRT